MPGRQYCLKEIDQDMLPYKLAMQELNQASGMQVPMNHLHWNKPAANLHHIRSGNQDNLQSFQLKQKI